MSVPQLDITAPRTTTTETYNAPSERASLQHKPNKPKPRYSRSLSGERIRAPAAPGPTPPLRARQEEHSPEGGTLLRPAREVAALLSARRGDVGLRFWAGPGRAARLERGFWRGGERVERFREPGRELDFPAAQPERVQCSEARDGGAEMFIQDLAYACTNARQGECR